MVYEIPAKRKQPPHKYPDLGFGPFSDPDLLPTRYSDQVVNTNIPENQPPSQPKYSTYDLSEVEKKMVDNFREQQGQSGQGSYSDSTPERRLSSRDQGGHGGQGGQGRQGGPGWQGVQGRKGGKGGQGRQGGPGWQGGQGGQGGPGWQGGQGGQGGQGEQLGPSGYSRDTVDISEYE